jgi:hypothetical protein
MTEVKTLVYFDIEATVLKSSGRPRISEISFLALDTQEFFDLNQKLVEKLKNVTSYEDILELETFLPRVLDKLTLCVYPMATIMQEVSKITGLDNYNLTGQPGLISTEYWGHTQDLYKPTASSSVLGYSQWQHV